jgi:hypothetical protein
MERLADLDRALKLLRTVIYDDSPGSPSVVFSGKSLDIMFERLVLQLKNTPAGKESALLDYWETELPEFRQRLIAKSESVLLPNASSPVNLVTEGVAAFATAPCPPAPKFP